MNTKNLKTGKLKSFIASSFLVLSDASVIYLSLILASYLVNLFSGESVYIGSLYVFYAINILLFFYSQLYTKRFDFWHESRVALRNCFFGAAIILFVLTSSNLDFPRPVFVLSFLFMVFFLPISKFILKRVLYHTGLWKKPARIMGQSGEFEESVFENHYLGYIKSDKDYETLFVCSNGLNAVMLNKIVEQNLKNHREIIFTPVLKEYDFSCSTIYSIFNSRTSLFSIENSLLNPINALLKMLLDFIIFIILLPIFSIVLGVIVLAMKIAEPHEKVFFAQNRLGKDGKIFKCFKLRTMKSDQSFMDEFLKNNPDEVAYYAKYHKFKNDPRITKIGAFLRATSLDELPQLFNVIKFEMSVVGPRPYMINERHQMGKDRYLILALRPGITGLWQVSGRSDTDFETRVKLDVWYVKNWSLYNDIIILIKTFKSVILRSGAK
ncbi:sugar transferase [Campylobacter fetus]|uniref:UDP-phosphate galactose phosphotransferase n=2 Tax=Campylobacter fetus TaxID=196 RepID=A0A5L8UBV8_CAMFE|nr:sugar transferase [Campylobacter fetus]EAI4415543.1 UDP-phosphate galactose phosphotransferase [Campylobacter fetus]EAI5408709.1 UDP-phosphate galactose phosphotransferase [Campylobacter fetus]EAI5647972.1 UDP-phosphate galactose phosphotransferase [Campylobacter fetus]EAI5946196.1 UDP-phosphate galactose phosphotransferase [Campylobacter fetus]EAJ0320082.1 UDP-phosphate galactose phosphotransferase [Campylobacter fetus]